MPGRLARLALSSGLVAIAAGCVALPVGTLKNQPAAESTVVAGRTGAVSISVLSGTLLGPKPGLVSDNGAGVISNNSGGLISNNGGGIISNNSGGYRLLHVADLVTPAAHVELTVVDLGGHVLTTKPAKSDKDGHFKLTGLKPASGLVFVKATYQQEGQTVTLMAPVAVAANIQDLTVDPATTLVAKKLLDDVHAGRVRPEAVQPAALAAAAKAIAAAMSDRAVVAASILPEPKAAETYDHMLAESPELAKAIGQAQTQAAASAAPASQAPSTTTGASVAPSIAPSASRAPSAAPSAAASVAPSPSPTVRPNGGVVSTFAGSGNAAAADGNGTAASFNSPVGLAWDRNGNLLVADQDNSLIRQITPAGDVTTFAGAGKAGMKNATNKLNAQFNHPEGLAVDAAGNVFVADRDNHRIRKIDTTGAVTTFAGSGSAKLADGKGTAASFNEPTSLLFDDAGNLVVDDSHNHCLRKIAPDGTVTTFVGNGTAGSVDGTGAAARFKHPTAICRDAAGVIFAVEEVSGQVRRIGTDGAVTTLPGTFDLPTGVAVDGAGKVYVAEHGGNTIRVIGTDGGASVLAGSGAADYADGTGTAAALDSPQGLLLDAQNRLYVADEHNNRIRRIQ